MAKKKITIGLESGATAATLNLNLTAKKGGSVVETKTHAISARPANNTKYQKWAVLAIAGQSNSVGYDESLNTVMTNPNSDPDRIKQLGLYGTDNLQIIPLGACAQNLQNMTTFGVTGGNGSKGLHLPLAELICKYLPEDYGIIVVPVAYGMTHFTKSFTSYTYNSTTMKLNSDNASNGTWQKDYPYYQMLRDRVKYCLDLGQGKSVNKFLGVIWCQGEADTAAHSGNSTTHGTLFQAMVDGLATEWATYNACSPTGAMDKSVWFVHDTTRYWRYRDNNAEGHDVATIWLGYQKYLGADHVVNILPLDDYTNAVNGTDTGGGGGNKTSSVYNSHFGNNAYRDVVAPKVLNCLLKHGMVHGQKATDRYGSTFEGICSVVGGRAQGVDIKEDGNVIWAISTQNSSTYSNGGFTSIIFDEDIKEVKITQMNPRLGIIYQYGKNNYSYKAYLLANGESSLNSQTNDRFWVLPSDNANNKNLLTCLWGTIWKSSPIFPSAITIPDDVFNNNNFASGSDIWTISVSGTNHITVKFNDTILVDKDDALAESAAPRIGFLLGWGAGSFTVNNASQLKIISATKSDGTVIKPLFETDVGNLSWTTDTAAKSFTITTTGTVSDVAVDSPSLATATLSGNTVTVTPTDAGTTKVTFKITNADGTTHTGSVPVTIAEDLFYYYFNIPSQQLVLSGSQDKYASNFSTNIPISNISFVYAEANKSTFTLESQTSLKFHYVSGSSQNAQVDIYLNTNNTHIGTAYLCTSSNGGKTTDIAWRAKK